MDSLTHLTLGACLGEAMLGKRLGKPALLLGAVAQNLPDLDGLAALWLPVSESLWFHRGITHALPVALLAAGGLALLARRWHRSRGLPLGSWFLFFAGQIALHDLLDTTNSYGTGLLEPFSHQRFSVHLLYVADPFFTLPLLVSALLLIFRRQFAQRRVLAMAAVGWAFGYVAYAAVNKSRVEQLLLASSAEANLPSDRYFITPTPLNTWLWYMVAASDSGYYAGYRSVFDGPERRTNFTYFPQNTAYLSAIRDRPDVTGLLRFADGFYTVEKQDDSLAIDVLRFGQVQGWEKPDAPFVFRYQLDSLKEDRLVVQRGRFAGWNRSTLQNFVQRIRGIEPTNAKP